MLYANRLQEKLMLGRKMTVVKPTYALSFLCLRNTDLLGEGKSSRTSINFLKFGYCSQNGRDTFLNLLIFSVFTSLPDEQIA